jgi:predicted HTH transcriptional regulator
MVNFFGKPIAQIDADDISSLIDTPEGQLFEIKSELPAEKNSSDPWYSTTVSGNPRKGPGDYAKQNIFKEIVAFANSEGGWYLITGVKIRLVRSRRCLGAVL